VAHALGVLSLLALTAGAAGCKQPNTDCLLGGTAAACGGLIADAGDRDAGKAGDATDGGPDAARTAEPDSGAADAGAADGGAADASAADGGAADASAADGGAADAGTADGGGG
jgi:hypothetical protein